MDFMTVLTYTLAVIETAALIGALVFATKAIKEKKNSNAKKERQRTSFIYVAVYLALNFLRNNFL